MKKQIILNEELVETLKEIFEEYDACKGEILYDISETHEHVFNKIKELFDED